jgi:glycosyltransferase involved in cell wall biosynthesis
MTNARNLKIPKKVIALVPNVLGWSPGQRVRIELWATFLEEAGWTVEFLPFEDDNLHNILYRSGSTFGKAKHLFGCYRRRLRQVLNGFSADVIFVYREAALVGPALIERLAARQRIPIIYDIDDPVFLFYRSPVNGWASILKFPRKTHKLFRLSTRVLAINHLIGDYAAKYNPAVEIMPNCVDTDYYKPLPARSVRKKAQLVWIGSHSTMSNLETIARPLARLQANHDSPFLVIGSGEINLPGVKADFRQWSAETEVSDLQQGDIGLLPLIEGSWNNWKFFYKLVQYMAIGLPVVAQKMGSNSEVIENGVNGFLVETEEEWFEKLDLLASNEELRRKIGAAARQTVEERFSTRIQMPRLIEIFEKVRRESKQSEVANK